MVQVAGIVGYKNSGKTTLTHALARELIARGHTVGVVKHTRHHLDLEGKDTAVLGESVAQVAIISQKEAALLWKKPLSLEDMLSYLAADIVLVEGFKEERTYPKIACLRGQPDDANLFDGLLIAAVGPGYYAREDVPLFDRDDVPRIADLVERKGFKLPNLDWGACGRETCYEMAREIVAGTGSVEECVPLSE